MLISPKDSLLVIILLSSVLLILISVCVLLALKFRKYRSRPYLLSCCFFLLQILGIYGVLLTAIVNGRANAHFDAVMRPGTLIMGFTTIVFLLAYIVEIKLPGKLGIRKFLYGISPFIVASAIMVMIHPGPMYSLDELFSGISRPDVLIRLIIVFLFIAYPIVVACLSYEWRKCLVSRKTVAVLHILSCLIAPAFIAGLACGFFPAIILNYILAITLDALVAYMELRIRIPATESVNDHESHQAADEPSILDTPEIWMNPDMTATELATVMGTNRTYLLNRIKEKGYSSYTDMINRKRVEYICDGLRKGADVNIIGLMFEAGFRSRSTASREFKRIVGCTPSEYQESILKATPNL